MRRVGFIALGLALLTSAHFLPSPASASSRLAVIEDCRERAVLVPGVEELVRERVPKIFDLVRDPLGRPLLLVDGARCERITIGETARPSSFALFMAVIESPDGGGCMSRWPIAGGLAGDLLPLCNFYMLFDAHTNRAVVKATRKLSPSAPIHHVRKLRFEQTDGTLGARYRFRAGGKTPSPFELNGIVRESPLQHPLTVSFWDARISGIERVRVQIPRVALGHLDGRLNASPGSEMAELLGTETPTPLGGMALSYEWAEVIHRRLRASQL